jgi:CoA:oxalate CoA-transferase
MLKTLDGLRIADFSMFVAGPFATGILADLGADVVKIEPLTGDPLRKNKVGPSVGGQSAQFQTFNHGKKSVTLDLKDKHGLEKAKQIALNSDVIFDNFRPGVMEKFGLDHSKLAQDKPTLVSISLSGFGTISPWSKNPGYDLIVQALGGGLSINGHEETGPAHIPFHLGDTAGGLYAAIAILAAVQEAQKTGFGRAYEVSMLDSQIHLCGDEVTFSGLDGWKTKPHGSGHPALAPYAVFETEDKPIVIAAVGTEKFWLNFVSVIGSAELANDKRFTDNSKRASNMTELTKIINKKLSHNKRDFWLQKLVDADVPAAPILSIDEVIHSEHVISQNQIDFIEVEGKKLAVPRIPIKEKGKIQSINLRAAPELGEHNDSENQAWRKD